MAYHHWDEPIKRTISAAQKADVELVIPKIGETVQPLSNRHYEPWWQNIK